KRQQSAAAKAAETAERAGAKLLVARAREVEARAFAILGQPDKAKAACERARQIFAEAGDQWRVADTLNTMSGIVSRQGELPESIRLLRQALAISRQTGARRGMALVLTNIGLNHGRQGR